MKTIISAISIMAVYAFICLGFSTSASALEIEGCNGIEPGAYKAHIDNLVHPIQDNHRSFYNGEVDVYHVDYIEPAACSAAVVFLVPDAEIDWVRNCFVISCGTSFDVKNAAASYDPNTGVSLSIPRTVLDHSTGHSVKTAPVKVVIDRRDGSVTLKSR